MIDAGGWARWARWGLREIKGQEDVKKALDTIEFALAGVRRNLA